VAVEVAFRISNWDTPLRVNPNRTAGRYNEAGSPATQYLSLHPLAPWAEYLRSEGLKDADHLSERRLRIWALRVDLAGAKEIGFGEAADHGLEAADLVSDDHGPCRRLGERFREDPLGPETIVVPSAALPGTTNIVIFGERTQIPYSWEPIDSIDIPSCVIAERSQPPFGIHTVVRYRGESHRGLEEWSSGRAYRFPDLPRRKPT
jgi:RES domain-containing protein